MKDIRGRVEDIRNELAKPLPDHKPKQKEKKVATKKASKKASKKESKKAKKASSKKAAKSDSNAVTLADLAKEFKLTGQKARQRLRAAGIEREEGGRWSWEPGSAALKAAKKALAGD